MVDIYRFLAAMGKHKPLLAFDQDIFQTPADHIAFGVHWRNSEGYLNNNNGGFSAKVAAHGWPELETYEFQRGVPVTKLIKGKQFHALPIHTNEKGGWDDAPQLIEHCLNLLPVSSSEVVACVLFGGGHAGQKYKASILNIEGMIRSRNSVVLHTLDGGLYDLLIAMGVVASPLPLNIPLNKIPVPVLYRDSQSLQKLLERAGVKEEELSEVYS